MSYNVLKGKLVISLEQAVAAPFCSAKLADSGARVIKVERKEGDFARYYDDFVKGQSTYFVWLNRGKESLIANIKDKKDIKLIQSITAKADIFIQNLAPNSLKKIGLDSGTLRKKNSKLITCDISGYGESGPYENMKAYDLLIQAETSLCSLTGSVDSPGRVGVSVCDIACGLNAYSLLLEAMIKKEKTGRGSSIKVSLFDSLSEWMNVPYLQYLYTKSSPQRVGLSHPSIVPYGCFKTKDKKEILLSIQNEREWASFSKNILNLSEEKEKKFKSPILRLKNKNEVNKIISEKFIEEKSKYLIKVLKKNSIAFGILNNLKDFSNHPQLKTAHSKTDKGKFKFIPPPNLQKKIFFKKVPGLGEHSKKIRKEFSKNEK